MNENSTSFRRKPESRRSAGMLHSSLWIPAFAGMTEMAQTMIKAEIFTIGEDGDQSP